LSAAESVLHGQIDVTPALARACEAYVAPNRGLHTEASVAYAMHPRPTASRATRLRNDPQMLRKNGLGARDFTTKGRSGAIARCSNSSSAAARGNRLLAIRQAQKERAVVTLDRNIACPKVRAALGRARTRIRERARRGRPAHARAPLLPLIAPTRLSSKSVPTTRRCASYRSTLRHDLAARPPSIVWRDISAKGD
jgi:hypothetical protein